MYQFVLIITSDMYWDYHFNWTNMQEQKAAGKFITRLIKETIIHCLLSGDKYNTKSQYYQLH